MKTEAQFELLTPAQVATLLDTNVATLQCWRQKGCGPVYHKLGKHVRYTRADVKQYLRESRRITTKLETLARAL